MKYHVGEEQVGAVGGGVDEGEKVSKSSVERVKESWKSNE